jgi:hypothetical protein
MRAVRASKTKFSLDILLLPCCALKGVINKGDLEDILTTDDVEEAFKHITEHPLLLKPDAEDKK